MTSITSGIATLEGELCKYTDLPQYQKTVLALLKTGKQYSAKLLAKITPDRDPRSTIRYLRKRGICIADAWVVGDGPRYKLYFLKETQCSPQLSLFNAP